MLLFTLVGTEAVNASGAPEYMWLTFLNSGIQFSLCPLHLLISQITCVREDLEQSSREESGIGDTHFCLWCID